MKKAGHIFLLLAALVVSMLLLEKAYEFGLRHNLNLKTSYLLKSGHSAQLLIHGPCEPLWMVSPAQVDSITGSHSYNLALSHSDFADNFLHLYLYLKHNPPPRMVLLYVTPESMDRRYNTFNTYRFAPYLGDSTVRKVVAENDPSYAKWIAVPFMKYAYYNRKVMFNVIQGYKHYFTGKQLPYYPDGFEPPAKRVWGNHEGEFVMLYKDTVRFEWDSLRAKYLAGTIRLARSRGIQVLLYESPVLKESLGFQANREEILRRIDSLAAGEKVRHVRFDELPLAADRKYFISTLNMNMTGLRIFNDTLARYLRNCGEFR
jgi:hypothetical protein